MKRNNLVKRTAGNIKRARSAVSRIDTEKFFSELDKTGEILPENFYNTTRLHQATILGERKLWCVVEQGELKSYENTPGQMYQSWFVETLLVSYCRHLSVTSLRICMKGGRWEVHLELCTQILSLVGLNLGHFASGSQMFSF